MRSRAVYFKQVNRTKTWPVKTWQSPPRFISWLLSVKAACRGGFCVCVWSGDTGQKEARRRRRTRNGEWTEEDKAGSQVWTFFSYARGLTNNFWEARAVLFHWLSSNWKDAAKSVVSGNVLDLWIAGVKRWVAHRNGEKRPPKKEPNNKEVTISKTCNTYCQVLFLWYEEKLVTILLSKSPQRWIKTGISPNWEEPLVSSVPSAAVHWLSHVASFSNGRHQK